MNLNDQRKLSKLMMFYKMQNKQRAYRCSQSACSDDVSREFLKPTRKNIPRMFLRSLKILSWRPSQATLT